MSQHTVRFAALMMLSLTLPARQALAQDKPTAVTKTAPRLLFVIDADTEEPLEGAEVKDIVTRNSMKTAKGGVIGLFFPTFVKETGALVEVSRPGYLTSTRIYVDVMEPTPLIIALLNVDSPRARMTGRQRGDSTVFQVEVVDENGSQMADATVAIVSGVSTILASRVTDSSGIRQLVVPGVSGEVQITVQKVGYQPYRQFYRLSVADTVFAQIPMRPLAQQLEAVTVTAKARPTRKVYTLNENDITNSKRPIRDALEVVSKLRPQMFGDRLSGMMGCGTVDYVYVNGRRIMDAPQVGEVPRVARSRAIARSSRGGTPTPTLGTQGRGAARAVSPASGLAAVDSVVRAVLAGIKPEHVAEMTYLDCFETRVPGVHRNNAIYVVLKPGIEYDLRRGSRLYQEKPKTAQPKAKP